MTRFYKFIILAALIFSSTLYAQRFTITGKVTSTSSGEGLLGANILLKGTNIGAATDEKGNYRIVADKGKYTITCSYIGYETDSAVIILDKDIKKNFSLKDRQLTLSVLVISDRAINRETPVAFSDVTKADLETQLGSQDIPMVLNTTPSVYATQQGGGAGDSRIDIRGFQQMDIGVMLNGIPINDMNSGWVYWSNWDGIGDATSSIQVQRGLSAVNLAVPSIGGTMNIITDPAKMSLGAKYKQEIGSGNFLKSTLSFNTGKIGGFAFNGSAVRKLGNGVIDRTWTDAWAYYIGASYEINANNRLELYALDAPQRHGQNSYAQNIAAYDSNYAKSLPSYNHAAIKKFPQAPSGRLYNENWNYVNPSYKGKQYWDGATHNRYDANFINEKENYYDKPVMNLNWYSQLSKKMSLFSTVYYLGGNGGSSTMPSASGNYYTNVIGPNNQPVPSRIVDWNKIITKNDASRYGSLGIIANSVNNEWTVGALSKGIYKVSDEFTTSFGIDWRTAQIQHFEEVRDLLNDNPNTYFNYNGNIFDTTAAMRQKHLGDKIGYWETNKINWFGAYAQGEYTKDLLTAYAMYGWTIQSYDYTNHFTNAENNPKDPPLNLIANNLTGFQLKGGASYRLTADQEVYANAGYVSKVPLYNFVIDYTTNSIIKNYRNEQFISFEVGYNSHFFDNKLTFKTDYYYTVWKNQNDIYREPGQSNIIYFITGLNSLHEGLEIETAYQSSRFYRLDAAFSLGYWKYLSDGTGTYQEITNSGVNSEYKQFYVNGLMVGDAPQTQLALEGTIYPIKGMQLQVVFRYNARYFSKWDPSTRVDSTDRGQVWKTPWYTIWDLHFNYKLPVDLYGIHFGLFAHVFNLLNTIYIQDATDDSQYNSYDPVGKQNHSASDAEVYLGIPRTFNVGINISY